MTSLPIDFHTHTTHSPDGENTPEEMCEKAIALGIERYAITDHIEINEFYSGDFDYPSHVAKSSQLLPELKEKYQGRLNLYYGVELGQALYDPELSKRLLNENNYDFVIGSCHMVRGFSDFYYIDYGKTDPEMLMDKYFKEVLEMCRLALFDVLGHLTYPLRYIVGEFGIKTDISKYENIIRAIFSELIKNNMGIEINTSGLRQKYGKLMPDTELVRIYREMGGEIITLGSDAHRTTDLGKGIKEGVKAAKEAGFDHIYYFENRNPVEIKI